MGEFPLRAGHESGPFRYETNQFYVLKLPHLTISRCGPDFTRKHVENVHVRVSRRL